MNKCYICGCDITDADYETWLTVESFIETKTVTLCVECAAFILNEIKFTKNFIEKYSKE